MWREAAVGGGNPLQNVTAKRLTMNERQVSEHGYGIQDAERLQTLRLSEFLRETWFGRRARRRRSLCGASGAGGRPTGAGRR